jgi:hypothetical protein
VIKNSFNCPTLSVLKQWKRNECKADTIASSLGGTPTPDFSYGLDDRGFDSRQGLGIFLFTTASRPTLGPTHPTIQWVSWAFSLGVKRPGREVDHSFPSNAEVKQCAELYFHSPNTS